MELSEFLREVCPGLGLQPRPFQRRNIRRKLERRMAELRLTGLQDYLSRVKSDLPEQKYLAGILTVTVSRFFRDRTVFETLVNSIFPAMLGKKGREDFRVWSIGCASGEEPYSLVLLWKENFENEWPQTPLSVVATDLREELLERAREGKFKKSSVEEIPERMLLKYFTKDGDFFTLDDAIRQAVDFRKHDILHDPPAREMDIVLCRNLAFAYFSKKAQVEVLKKIFLSLKEQGALIIGRDESLPLTYPALFTPIFPKEKIYRKLTLLASQKMD